MRRFGGQKTAKAARADGAGPLFLGRVDFFCRRTACVGPEGRDRWAERLPRGAAWGRSLTGAAMGKRRAQPFASCDPCRTRGKPPLPELRRAGRPLAFPCRACSVRAAYSSFSTAVQVPSAVERENGCALIPCVVLVGFRLAGGKLLHMAGVGVVNRALCRRPPWRSCGVPALRERLRAPVRWQGPASLERQEKNSLFTAGWSVLSLKRESARCGTAPPCPKSGGKTVFFRDMTGVWFEAQALQTENAFGAVGTIRSCLGEGAPSLCCRCPLRRRKLRA